MKTLLLTAAAILTLTFNSQADDRNKNNTSAETTSIASKIMGSPDEEAPAELAHLLAKPQVVKSAPMVIGNADEEAPLELKDIPAHPIQVPVAPFVIGNADEEAPIELRNTSAYN